MFPVGGMRGEAQDRWEGPRAVTGGAEGAGAPREPEESARGELLSKVRTSHEALREEHRRPLRGQAGEEPAAHRVARPLGDSGLTARRVLNARTPESWLRTASLHTLAETWGFC